MDIFYVSTIDNVQVPCRETMTLHAQRTRDQAFVAMASPINSVLPGRKSPARSVGGTQNRSSESGPNTQPSFMVELSVKEADILPNALMMNMISEGPILLKAINMRTLDPLIIAPCTRIVLSFRPRNDDRCVHLARTQRTRPSRCGLSKVPPPPHPSRHPTLGSSCRQSQKRCGVHLARTRQT